MLLVALLAHTLTTCVIYCVGPAVEKKSQPSVDKFAQQAMFNARQLLIQCDPQVVIDLENNDGNQPHEKISAGSQKTDPTTEIRNILLSDTAWLTCTVVDAAQHLLEVMADGQCSGFQSVAVGLTMQFEIQQSEFVQILHCDSGHWLTISTSGCGLSEVLVYDSLYSGASRCVQCQIASLLSSPSSHVMLNFVDMQRQSSTYDCGLFAVAFATWLQSWQIPF